MSIYLPDLSIFLQATLQAPRCNTNQVNEGRRVIWYLTITALQMKSQDVSLGCKRPPI